MVYMKRIGIVAAMQVEAEPLQERFGAPVFEKQYGVFSVKMYVHAGKELYFATSSVGEIAASACTQLLITAYNVELIFNYGLCGSLDGSGLGETFLVSGIVHYQFDCSDLDGSLPGKYDRFDSAVIPTDENMLKLVKGLFPHLKTVVCASGDKFIADSALKNSLSQTYGAGVCEMESAGVLITSKNAGVPQVILKTVSDGADDADTFVSFVSGKNIEYINVVAKVIELI